MRPQPYTLYSSQNKIFKHISLSRFSDEILHRNLRYTGFVRINSGVLQMRPYITSNQFPIRQETWESLVPLVFANAFPENNIPRQRDNAFNVISLSLIVSENATQHSFVRLQMKVRQVSSGVTEFITRYLFSSKL